MRIRDRVRVPPPLDRDVCDAVEMMTEGAGDISDFRETARRHLRIESLPVDLTSWPAYKPGELAKLTVSERRDELVSYRGPEWASRAEGWIKTGTVPTVVVVRLPDEASAWMEPLDLGDGRGRVSVALGMGWKTVPVSYWTHRAHLARKVKR